MCMTCMASQHLPASLPLNAPWRYLPGSIAGKGHKDVVQLLLHPGVVQAREEEATRKGKARTKGALKGRCMYGAGLMKRWSGGMRQQCARVCSNVARINGLQAVLRVCACLSCAACVRLSCAWESMSTPH